MPAPASPAAMTSPLRATMMTSPPCVVTSAISVSASPLLHGVTSSSPAA